MTDTGRSGGKILKYKRATTRTTPYDRPPPDNPNWLTAPAKFVAGVATKILSSLWNPKTWDNSSSSSSKEKETGSGSDDENPSHAVDELNQQQGSLSQKSQTLHLIEQLLMLEQFSREESDRLIEIIKSRVLDYSMREGGDAGPSMIRKSGLQSNLDNGFYALKSAVTPQATEGDAGSTIETFGCHTKGKKKTKRRQMEVTKAIFEAGDEDEDVVTPTEEEPPRSRTLG